MRSKEGSSDYRYFPEPDLTPIEVSREQVAAWKAELPELPVEKRHRYEEQLGLSAYDTRVLTEDVDVAAYFDAVLQAGAPIKQAANWVMGDITAYAKEQKQAFTDLALTPESLAELISLIEDNTISGKIAKEVLPELLEKGGSAKAIVEAKGLVQISDVGELEAIIDQLIAENPDKVEQFRAGKDKLQGFFVGQVMKATGGRADPKLTNKILMPKLKG